MENRSESVSIKCSSRKVAVAAVAAGVVEEVETAEEGIAEVAEVKARMLAVKRVEVRMCPLLTLLLPTV